MNALASAATASAMVTLGLSDGRKHTGQLASFSPFANHYPLRTEGGTDLSVPAPQVAYVAFHRENEPLQTPPPAHLERVRVQIVPDTVVEVLAPPRARWGPQGFFARPLDESSPYRDYFFFTPRVRIVEASVYVSTPTLHETRRKARLGELLAAAGLVSAEDIARALEEQRRRPGHRLGELMVELGILEEKTLMLFFAQQFGRPLVDLDTCAFNPAALEALPASFTQAHGVLAVDLSERSITVAIADPLAVTTLDEVRRLTGRHVIDWLATPSQLRRYLSTADSGARSHGSAHETLDELKAQLSRTPPRIAAGKEPALDDADTGVIRLVNQILSDAFRSSASDVHVEPGMGTAPGRVRLRIDGDCVPYLDLPAPLSSPVVARLKVMAGMDIAEHRKPQDGKIRLHVDATLLDLRAATLPTVGGAEDVVLRLLPPYRQRTLAQMGLSERNLRELTRLVEHPHGLLLVVGPTGSGKTTTLHGALGHLNTDDRKIWTAEDPVEIIQPGLRQVQINHRIGLDFATAMRSFLRTDPDVIMVGEVRDRETAATAIEASLTGHLVLSTLHTNSAPETVVRLLDMGLDPFSFADSLLGVLAQRLVRTLCPACREPYVPGPEERAALATAYGGEASFEAAFGRIDRITLQRGRGCDRCAHTGLQGRTGVHELLVVDDELRHAISHKAPADQLRALAVGGGMTTLLQDGVARVVAGQTDLARVLAVCAAG